MMKKLILPLLSLLLLSHAPVSSAVNCYEQSPTLIELGEDYWNVNAPLDISGDEAGLAWLADLKGKWEGEMTFRDCLGSASNPRVNLSHYSVKAELGETSEALFSARFEAFDKEQRTTRSQRVDYLLKNNIYTLSSRGTSLTANERQRRVFVAKPASNTNYQNRMLTLKDKNASLFQERFVEISLQDGLLTVKVIQYHNGVYAFTQILTLTRR